MTSSSFVTASPSIPQPQPSSTFQAIEKDLQRIQILSPKPNRIESFPMLQESPIERPRTFSHSFAIPLPTPSIIPSSTSFCSFSKEKEDSSSGGLKDRVSLKKSTSDELCKLAFPLHRLEDGSFPTYLFPPPKTEQRTVSLDTWHHSLIQAKETLLPEESLKEGERPTHGARPFRTLNQEISILLQIFDAHLFAFDDRDSASSSTSHPNQNEKYEEILGFFLYQSEALTKILNSDSIKYQTSFRDLSYAYKEVVELTRKTKENPPGESLLLLNQHLKSELASINRLCKQMQQERDLHLLTTEKAGSLLFAQQEKNERNKRNIHLTSLLKGNEILVPKTHPKALAALKLWREYKNAFWSMSDKRLAFLEKFISSLIAMKNLYREGIAATHSRKTHPSFRVMPLLDKV